MKMGYVLMRYGLDADGNEISGAPLCASTNYKKVYKKLRHIFDEEAAELDIEVGEGIRDYDNQIVVEYPEYSDEAGVRYIIESLEIL